MDDLKTQGTDPKRHLSRRSIMVVAGLAGGASLLAACAQQTTTPSPAPTSEPTVKSAAPVATTAPSAPATPTAKPTPAVAQPLTAERLIDKPLPPHFFRPMGAIAEMRFEDMANRGYTVPNSLFFVRDHQASVTVDPKLWKLSIEGDGVENPYTLTYDELLAMPATTITRYVECAGNGRSFFQTFLKKPAEGGQWRLGAYGVSEWTGVPLSDLIKRAGLKKTATEVMPIGLDKPHVRRPMPVSKAMEPDTMLVYMMNGDLLPIDHGFPARVIVPGWVGVANIKWVGSIQVTEKHNATDWNTNLYIMIGPDYKPEPPAKGPAINEQVMKSALALPWPASLKSGTQKVTGYAWSPNGKISKVDVSVDGGKTFAPAKLIEPNIERAGVRWEFTFDAKPGMTSITPRATDEKGNVQPPISQQKWNQQGYLFGAMVPHPIEVK